MIKDHPPHSGPPPSSSAPLFLCASIFLSSAYVLLSLLPGPAAFTFTRYSHFASLTFSHFCLCSVSPLTFSNQPTRYLAHHFLLPSTYSFSIICHSRLSLGKLQLFYVLDLPPHPSLPSLLFVFSHQAPLCAAVSLVFSPHVSITVCLTPYVCVCVCTQC